MKNKYIFLLLVFLMPIFSINRHINNKHNNENYKKKSVESCELLVSKEDSSCYCYKKYIIPKVFFDFIELSPLLCVEFIFFIIDNYAFDIKKDLLKNTFYTLSPDDVWNMMNAEENFDCEFITMINDIYNKDEFILIYKTRMTIEFIIFAFNIKEKTTKYQYAYFYNAELKKVLHNLLEFSNKGHYLLEDKLSEQQIEDFKKFLHKYISHKSINHMIFLNELRSFKHFLDIFFKEKSNNNISFSQQLAMMNRFNAVFK